VVAATARRDGDPTARLARRDRVEDRVLDQRLQDERWHQARHRLRVRFQAELKPILQTEALDLQVAADERPLLSDRDLVQ
jgi:hypothetical protein